MWLTITNVAVLNDGSNPDIVTNVVGSLLLAKNAESFTYDLDGNLTSDSLWTNVWNGENRRVTIESRSTLPAAAKRKVAWTILADGRWVERIVSTNNGTSYFPALTNRYVWDKQILLAVLDHTNGVVVSFIRGLDLSGSIQGAGAVGGVLAVKAGTSAQCGNMANTTHFTCYDGNGNVTALMNAATGEESARYEYAPFAEQLRETGPMAKLNPIRFSTQYHDDYTEDDKYVFRDLRDGRWLSRDPIEEEGGLNLYAFVENNGVSWFDYLGKQAIQKPQPQTPIKFYCDAAKKHPDNRWLKCACDVSGEINQLIAALYVTGPFVENPKKNGEIIRWFDCTRSCILKKFKEFYKVYDGGASMGDVNLTPHWEAARKKCIGNTGATSAKDCCSAMVVAEQSAIEDCKDKCGAFPGDPTKLPIPNFDGDFSKLEDRIKYGLKRCCEDSKSKGKNSESK